MKKFTLFVAFISGMAVTVIELAAARLLAPYFGASLFVWTNVIGIILVGLALGYFLGGRIADRQKSPALLFHLIGAAGVFVFAIPFIVKVIVPLTVVSGMLARTAASVLIADSFFTSLVLFLPPVLLLGMTSPFLIRIASREVPERIGTVSGRIFGWSTVGSILGVFFTGIIFIPFFGTRATIFGTAIALILLAVIGERSMRGAFAILLLMAVGVSFSIRLGPLRADAKLLFEKESPYQYIRVEEKDGSRYLIFNEGNGPQTVWNPRTIETGFLYDYFATLPSFFPKNRQLNILMIGLGGGATPRQYSALYPDRPYHIDAVEIDAEVVDVAKKFFALSPDRLSVTVGDGRMFLTTSRKQYDIILLDAFAQEHYIPWHLATKEFFTLVRDHLAPDGFVAFNVDARDQSSLLFQSIVRTVGSIFPHVATIPMASSLNYVLFARPVPIDFASAEGGDGTWLAEKRAYLVANNIPVTVNEDAMLLTDDRAPIELLTDAIFLREAGGIL